MAKRNGFSELAKLLVRYPTQGQREKLKQLSTTELHTRKPH